MRRLFFGVAVASAMAAVHTYAQDRSPSKNSAGASRGPTFSQRISSFGRNLIGAPVGGPEHYASPPAPPSRESHQPLAQTLGGRTPQRVASKPVTKTSTPPKPMPTMTGKSPSTGAKNSRAFDPFSSDLDRSINSEEPAASGSQLSSRRTQAPKAIESDLVELDGSTEPSTSPRALPVGETAPASSRTASKAAPSDGPTSSRRTNPPAASAPHVARAEKFSVTPVAPEPENVSDEGETSPEPVTEPVAEQPHQRPVVVESPAASPVVVEDRIVVTRKSPTISIETIGPRRIVVGKEAQYTIYLRNTGDVPANDVVVSVSIPPWAEIADARPTIGSAGRTNDAAGLQWTISSAAPDSLHELSVKIIARRSQPFDLGVRWTCESPMSQATVEVDEPKLHMAISGPNDVTYGQQQIYKLTISNPGTGDADDVVVHLLPITASDGATASHRIGKLKAGASMSVEIELTARQAGKLSIRAEATADAGLKSDALAEVWVRRPALEVVASAPKMHYAGTPVTCEVHVRNTGDSPARAVNVNAILPGGAEFISAGQGGQADAVSGEVAWTIPALPPGAEQVVSFKYKVKSAGNSRVEAVAAAEGDVRASAMAQMQVLAVADLVLEVIDSPGPIPVGDDTVYTVKVRNRGTSGAEDVSMEAYFSNGIEPVSVEGGPNQLSPGTVTFQPTQVAAGAEATYKIHARAGIAGNHQLRVELQCKSTGTRLMQERATLFYGEDSVAAPVQR